MGRRIVITYFIIIMDFAVHQNVGSQQYLANDFSDGLPNPYDDYHFITPAGLPFSWQAPKPPMKTEFFLGQAC